MLTGLNKMLTESLPLEPDTWIIIGIAIVLVAFVVALVGGLFTGDYKKSVTLMKKVIASPANALAAMKQMPASVKQQYKRARITGAKPSDYVSEDVCVNNLYKRSLISKIWLVTLVATAISASLVALVAPFAVTVAAKNIAEGNTDSSVMAALGAAGYIMPLVVVLVGAVLTLIGGIIGKASLSGAVKTYAKFVTAVDGDSKGVGAQAAQAAHAAQAAAAAQAQAQPQQTQAQAQPQSGYSFEAQPEPVVEAQVYEPVTEVQAEYGGAYEAQSATAEPVNGYGGYGEQTNNGYGEPVNNGYAGPMNNGYGEPVNNGYAGP
ncbi:MAG: hypothetical protein J1F33_01765, partial [Clostridiales bacterium]|nr:hypothetical protein [Clostridiales bacterium]